MQVERQSKIRLRREWRTVSNVGDYRLEGTNHWKTMVNGCQLN